MSKWQLTFLKPNGVEVQFKEPGIDQLAMECFIIGTFAQAEARAPTRFDDRGADFSLRELLKMSSAQSSSTKVDSLYLQLAKTEILQELIESLKESRSCQTSGVAPAQLGDLFRIEDAIPLMCSILSYAL